VKQAEYTTDTTNLSFKAPAKINLYLKVLSRRHDGYHEIESVMQKITLFDRLHLAKQGKSISLSCPGGKVSEGPENLAYRAAETFFSAVGRRTGVRIVLEKNIPVAAGLGGGSSDAAAVLHGLNLLMDAGLPLTDLLRIGLQLGADVPFFVNDYSCAKVTGIGERLEKIEPLQGYWIVVVNPGFALSTKWVYENLPLTSGINPYILARGQNRSSDSLVVSHELVNLLGNDLEAVSISRYPEIGDIRKELINRGAAAALMSGSGPTVFGLFADIEEAQQGFAHFAGRYGNRVFLVKPHIP